jgi:hypothetical protein
MTTNTVSEGTRAEHNSIEDGAVVKSSLLGVVVAYVALVLLSITLTERAHAATVGIVGYDVLNADISGTGMGFDKQLVAHGMRSLASTILNEEGFDADVIEAALAHTGKNEVRNAYNRANYLERRTPMMKWWSEHIEKAATGNMSLTGNKGLKVVGE